MTRLAAEGPWRAALAVALALAFWGAYGKRPRRSRAIHAGLVVAAAGAAVWMAASRASVVDDAFVSFRYAAHLLDGEGLVFNPGERVEGYTNLLWVLLVAAGTAVTGVELPLVALVGNLVVTGANVAVTAWAARRLTGGGAFPLAALLLAGNGVFLSHGTTGLETGLVALLVQLGFVALLADGPRASAAAGLALTLATLTRPDAAIFLGLGGLAAASRERGDRQRLARSILAFAAPVLLLVAAQVFRVTYYGDWAPNTAYAKSASEAYWSQGFVYLVDFWLGSRAVWWVAAALGWAALGPGPVGARAFVAAGVLLQVVYVAKLGGDFMSGRFFVVLLPLLAIACEAAWRRLGPRGGALLAGALLAGLGSGSLVAPERIRWWIADEGRVYPVVAWSPLRIAHPAWDLGVAVGETLRDRGITPAIGSGTIGMLGYYGGLELIDIHGLTDRTVAQTPLRTRGRPGHEKNATRGYLRERGVTLVQSNKLCNHERWRDLWRVTPPTGGEIATWCLLTFDPALVRRLREEAPEWGLPQPHRWLEAYVASLPERDPREVEADLEFLRAWFGDEAPQRLARIEAAVTPPDAPTTGGPRRSRRRRAR